MSKEYKYENRIVAFLDILGYKNHIMSTQYDHKSRQTLFNIMKYLRRIQNDNYDGDFSMGILGREISVFSDSIVISYPIAYEACVFHIIIDIIHIQNNLMHMGFLVRGGIEIGLIFHDANIVFGPAMVKAYEIESKKAKYPRIIINNDVLQYGYNNPSNHHTKEQEMEYINYLVKQDMDREIYIDNIAQYQEFEEDEYDIFLDDVRDIIISGMSVLDDSIKEKYIWLKDYYNSVIDTYGITYKKYKI